MKNLLFLLLTFPLISVFAQNGAVRGDLPVDNMVQLALMEDFPGATNLRWQAITNGYEARFVHQQYQMRVHYNHDGMLLFQEFVVPEIHSVKLTKIWEHLAENYPGYGFNGLFLCEELKTTPSEQYYCADIRYRGQRLLLHFDTQQTPIKP